VSTIASRWDDIRARVAAACAAAGRAASDVTIVAVSKTHPADAVREALAAGATDFGENYAQELADKMGSVAGARWHYIGRLQRNKAKLVAGKVALVHAVDSVELAEELAKRAAGVVQPVLIAVNVAGEASKGGVTVEGARVLAERVRAIAGVRLDGLMTMPPPDDDPEPHFRTLAALGTELGLGVLSMGMSDDFELAIRCGATHVRVGTAIFGARQSLHVG
jgi:hypothetical protein